jgi:hypothetical protein
MPVTVLRPDSVHFGRFCCPSATTAPIRNDVSVGEQAADFNREKPGFVRLS